VLPDSPYAMLMAHFDRVLEAVDKLKEMMELYLDGEFTKASELSIEVSKLEHEADEVKQHMRHSLPRMIFMPVSRQDMLDLLTSNERIADTAQDVAQILDLRQTKVPETLHPVIKNYLGNVVDSVHALKDMMVHLGTLFESSFAKNEAREIIELGQHVHEHEYKADVTNKQAAKAVYALEGQETPMALFHMLRFLNQLDSVADNAENSALRMVVIVAK
jgi:predicted phosphate transport protein (TIGR00153 family)